MIPREMAASLGLPVTEGLAKAGFMSHTDLCADMYSAKMLGNGMSIPCVGLMIATTLVCAIPLSQ